MNSNHPPTPWCSYINRHIKDNVNWYGSCVVDNDGCGIIGEVCSAAADHIVKCVNSHEDLVNALRNLLNDTQHVKHKCKDADCSIRVAREALEKAGVE